MKKKLTPILALAGVFLLAACDKTEIIKYDKELDRSYSYNPDSLFLNYHGLSLFLNESVQLEANILPALAYDAKLNFSTSDITVATVDANGLVTAVGAGECSVIVTSDKNPNATETIPVVVLESIPCDQTTIPLELSKGLDNTLVDQMVRFPSGEPTRTASIQNEIISYYDVKEGVPVLQKQRFDVIDIVCAKDEAYMLIDEKDYITKTEDGAREYDGSSWIIYTDPDYNSYLYHTLAASKNRLSVKTTYFIGNPRLDALYAILDSLFTSGHEYMATEFSGGVETSDLKNYARNVKFIVGGGAYGNKSRMIIEQLGYTDVATGEDESNSILYIPARTPYTEDIRIDYTWSNGAIRQFNIYVKWSWEEKGVTKQVTLERYKTYYVDEEVELFYPNPKDYGEVYDIYDL